MSGDAKVRVRVALVGALAAIAGTVAGSATTGVVALHTTTRQINSTAARSHDEFIRGQRVKVYSEVLTANFVVLNAERALVTTLDASGLDADDLIKADGAMVRALDRLRQATFAVSLVGSSRSSSAADSLLRTHAEFGVRTHTLIAKIAAQFRGRNLSVGNGAHYNKHVVPELADHLAEFMDAAREDLGLPDYSN